MTARDTLGPLQTAIYVRLTGDATLMNLITGVFDHVPEGTDKPYVVVGEAFATPRNSQDRFGRRTAQNIHVWSDQLGYSQVNQIANRIIALLDHQPLTVTGHDVVLANFEFQQTLDDPDRRLRHGVVRFGLTTEQQ